jgi:hypothetical protein
MRRKIGLGPVPVTHLNDVKTYHYRNNATAVPESRLALEKEEKETRERNFCVVSTTVLSTEERNGGNNLGGCGP